MVQLSSIFKLLELGGQIQQPVRFNNNPHNAAVTNNNSIFTMSNIYLLNLLCTIIRRLVKVAVAHPN